MGPYLAGACPLRVQAGVPAGQDLVDRWHMADRRLAQRYGPGGRRSVGGCMLDAVWLGKTSSLRRRDQPIVAGVLAALSRSTETIRRARRRLEAWVSPRSRGHTSLRGGSRNSESSAQRFRGRPKAGHVRCSYTARRAWAKPAWSGGSATMPSAAGSLCFGGSAFISDRSTRHTYRWSAP